jgi:addiction module RelB/DinJ family antitoxin
MNIEIDDELRTQALDIFKKIGITEEEAIRLFYKRTVACGRMPFSDESKEKSKIKKKRMNERFAEWDAF